MSSKERKRKHGETVFSIQAPDAAEAFVAGTFNDWNPRSQPLVRDSDGRWTVALDLPPGRYEYKFIVDGQWCCEPGCDKPHDDSPGWAANEFGTMNRVLVVELGERDG